MLIARALDWSLALLAQPSSLVFVGLGALDYLPWHPSLRAPLSAPLSASSLFPFFGHDLVCFQVCGGALKTLVLPCY